MENQTPHIANIEPKSEPGFHSLRIVIVVLLVMTVIPLWAAWYGDEVSVPRYCEAPATTLTDLERVLREKRPAGDESRIPYIRAAKLLFLLPRQSEESIPAYLSRVQLFIEDNC